MLGFGLPDDLTTYKLLTDWGSFIGGVLALIAGGAAYFGARQAAKIQVKGDREREDRQNEALLKSIATEVRQLTAQALAAHESLKRLAIAATPDNPITARMIEDSTRLGPSVVYQAGASRIGALAGSAAMDVVIVYNTIELAKQGAASLMRSRTPDNIAPVTVAAVAEAFLNACQYSAQEVLPKLKTGVPAHDDKDLTISKSISNTQVEWDAVLRRWHKQN